MCSQVAIVYNQPLPSRYNTLGEERAVFGILDTKAAVHQALLELGYKASQVPLIPPVEQTQQALKSLNADLVFNLFEGFCGQPETEALVPEVASALGLVYTGCPSTVLALALDKAKTKAILEAARINTPRYQLLKPETLSLFQLHYPCIVKPCNEDASHGLSEASVVRDFVSLAKQITMVSNAYGGQALVEEFIDGREFNATILGNSGGTALPVSEIVYTLPLGMPRILTFTAKWEPDSLYFQGSKAVCPAPIPDSLRQHLAETALSVFQLLGCRGYARVDMRLDEEGRLYVIEVNPNPDISPDSGAVRQARAAGMTYTQFIEKIVLLALEGIKK